MRTALVTGANRGIGLAIAAGMNRLGANAVGVPLGLSAPEALRVQVNSTCPGWVPTRMGGEAASRTPEEAADTAIWVAGFTPRRSHRRLLSGPEVDSLASGLQHPRLDPTEAR
jgi:NAD(P)-dependent dehydrogenase (short-subunit alcohol dehydrogenase family)